MQAHPRTVGIALSHLARSSPGLAFARSGLSTASPALSRAASSNACPYRAQSVRPRQARPLTALPAVAHYTTRAGSIQASGASVNTTQRSNEPPLPPPNAPPPKTLRSLSPAPASTSKVGQPIRASAGNDSQRAPSGPPATTAASNTSPASSPATATSSPVKSTPSAAPSKPSAATQATTTASTSSSLPTSSAPSDPAQLPQEPEKERVTLLSRSKKAYETLKFLFLFYLNGVKQIFRNRTRVVEIQTRAKEGGRALSREESQLIKIHNSDMRKLPLFLAIVLILEELLPLVVIYAPGLLPSTCILPSQIAKIRSKEEVVREGAVRRLREAGLRSVLASGSGGAEVPTEAGAATQAASDVEAEEAKSVVAALQPALLKDLVQTFKLPTWGGAFLQRSRLVSHLAYLRADDALMAGTGIGVGDEVPQVVDGLARACTERGLRASGVDSAAMSHSLRKWLSITRPSHASPPAIPELLALPLELYSDAVATSTSSSGTTLPPPSASSTSDRGVLAEAKEVASEVVAAEREVLEREERVKEEVRRKEAADKGL